MRATKKGSRKYPDWVVVTKGAKIGEGEVGELAHCERCGEKLILGLPLRLEAFAQMGLAFSKSHASCQPREPDLGKSEGR